MVIKSYKSFARPLLEYNSVICCPHHVNLTDAIKNVQRRFTKQKKTGLHDISYVDRLKSRDIEL